MPRSGANIYSKPAGTTAVTATTIESAKYNSVIDDLVTDANTARPIVAGGTAATTAAGARTALGLVIGTDVMAYDATLSAITAYTTTATAAGTTTLTAASVNTQFFTGTTTQTLVLPVTSTLVLGRPFLVVNNSTGAVAVQSSGLNAIASVPSKTSMIFICILASGTTAASWDAKARGFDITPALMLAQIGAAPLASPTFTGVPAAPTAAAATSTTQLATTEFVATSFAPLASPTFTGVPAVPTATAGTNTTQAASTAFVTAASGGMTLLGTLTTTSGTAQTLSGLTLTTYKALYITAKGVSFSNSPLSLELNALQISAANSAGSDAWSGTILVDLTNSVITASLSFGTAAAGTTFSRSGSYTTASTSISFTGGTFDAGSILVYGVK